MSEQHNFSEKIQQKLSVLEQELTPSPQSQYSVLTLQLPDALKQQVLTQAEQYQVSPETLALQILTHALTASQGSQLPAIPILSFFYQLHQAYCQGQDTLQVPCNATSLYIAEILYRSNQITDFQLDPTPESTQLHLTLNPHCTAEQILQSLAQETPRAAQDSTDAAIEPEIQALLVQANSTDATERMEAIAALGDHYAA